jgi:hypothetical protein
MGQLRHLSQKYILVHSSQILPYSKAHFTSVKLNWCTLSSQIWVKWTTQNGFVWVHHALLSFLRDLSEFSFQSRHEPNATINRRGYFEASQNLTSNLRHIVARNEDYNFQRNF